VQGGVQLDETNFLSPTSTTTNTLTTIYSTVTASSIAYRVIGFVDIAYTSGTGYSVAPTLVQGKGGEALSALSSLGYGQTFQGVGRASGTTYYNTTGRPIFLYYQFNGGASFNGILNIGGVTLSSWGTGTSTNGLTYIATAVVPAGMPYSFSTNGTFSGASELR
jgi:hypothetical protein